MTKIVFLEGENIYLRGIEEEDLSREYMQWLNDTEVCKYNSHAIFPNSKHKMTAYYNQIQDNKSAVVLAIIDNATDKHIGNVSLQAINWVSGSAEFAILLGDKSYWKKNVGFEAAKLIVEYGFKRLNLHRIYCGTSAENIGMQKLAAKLNMTEEGRRRGAMFKDGKYIDMLEYGVLKHEYES